MDDTTRITTPTVNTQRINTASVKAESVFCMCVYVWGSCECRERVRVIGEFFFTMKLYVEYRCAFVLVRDKWIDIRAHSVQEMTSPRGIITALPQLVDPLNSSTPSSIGNNAAPAEGTM